jgi:Pentapeptide repeats (8 copies)/CorA-like Mg2+ transporter protein
MTLLSVKSTPDQEDCSGEVPCPGSVDEQLPCPAIDSSARPEEGTDAPVLAVRGPEKPMWVDLLSPNREQLEEVCQTLGFSPEVITHCLLPAHTPKVIPIDSALFLVTFLGACAPQGLFVLRALKICVAPGFLLTVRGRASTTPGVRQLRLPDLPNANHSRPGHLLRVILEGVVESYKTIGADLGERLAGETRREPRQWQREHIWRQQIRRKGEQFGRFLRQQQVFLQEVARAGGTLFDADDHMRVRWLAERVEVPARRVGEIVRTPQEGRSLIKQELKVILTEAEKQTVLIGRRFASAHFTKIDLARAVFREADLAGTKFVQSDLRGADFHKANLQGAVFSLCDLHGADFAGARLEGTNFLTSFGLSPVMWGYIRSRGGVV